MEMCSKMKKARLAVIITVFFISNVFSSCSVVKASFGGYSDYFSTSFCYKGQWSSWEAHYIPDYHVHSAKANNGDIIGLRLSDSGGNTYFSFLITDYERGKKVCEGTVTYYVNDTYPNAEALAKANTFVIPNYRRDETPSVKRTATATIKIVNNGRKPATFNIWYDDIGVGFDVQNVYWSK
jgi:hypothetical protein